MSRECGSFQQETQRLKNEGFIVMTSEEARARFEATGWPADVVADDEIDLSDIPDQGDRPLDASGLRGEAFRAKLRRERKARAS